MSFTIPPNLNGLTDKEVELARQEYGQNEHQQQKKNPFLGILIDLLKDPMFLLLLIASLIYFISGEWSEAFFMLFAIGLVSLISIYQESRSNKALKALKALTHPLAKVIRNGQEIEIPIEEIVLGDLIIIEEGHSVPADANILQANDFTVNESILTGESFSVSKDEKSKDNRVFQGTVATGGRAICQVLAIGAKTELGKIGIQLESVKKGGSPLQKQIRRFVFGMAIIGLIVFLSVWVINYLHSHLVIDSLLKALTLAMSILPEEIPVAFTTFMALGAWRLMQSGIIVKDLQTVETLGSATVICVDKTGTITENRMQIAKLYISSENSIITPLEKSSTAEQEFLEVAMWASEPVPFDAMEIAIHEAYQKSAVEDERPNYKMRHEYPLSGKPPMMTHIFENSSGKRIIASKGAPEAILAISDLSEAARSQAMTALESLSTQGYRILGLGYADFMGDQFPLTQQEFQLSFLGFIAFYDPPKANMKAVLKQFYQAGIRVKIITGDNSATTRSIARQIDFEASEDYLEGETVMQMSDVELAKEVKHINIFTRMFPEAKLRVINSLKAQGETVAMTGDGVNDGPALKAANIGIAMGKRGTEIAKQAAALVLMDDDLQRMVTAVAMGRKIYSNLKKAIQYIISIHIPIILTVLLPLVLGWAFPNIFSPVHVIFLELIMGPTCSIIYENEPIEKNSMSMAPRLSTNTFFQFKELIISIIQGLAITAACLTAYQFALQSGSDENSLRGLVFITLIFSNILLTLVNRSFHYSILHTFRYKNNLMLLMIGLTLLLTILLFVITPVAQFFAFSIPSAFQILMAFVFAAISVLWFELYKWVQRITILR